MDLFYRRAVEGALLRAAHLELSSPPQTFGLDGRRSGRRSGNALEFAEYREYQAGDDLRRLDWGVYARSEQLMVKLYSEEVDPRCDIVLDESASMAAVGREKAAAALGLAALLARVAENTGFSLAVWHAGEELEKEPRPADPLQWRHAEFTATASPGVALGRFAGAFQPHGIRFVISDLLWPEEPEAFFRRLAPGAMRVVVLALEFRADLEPDANGNVMIFDVETGEERELFFDDAVRRCYADRLRRHRELWDRSAREHGVQLIRLKVEALFPVWELEELFRWGVLK